MHENSTPVIVTICLRGYDSISCLHGLFYEVRREFCESQKKISGKVTKLVDGRQVYYRYTLSKRHFSWEAKAEGKLLEKSYQISGGYCIVSWNEQGMVFRKARFGKNLEWVQTSYFENTGRPSVVISPLMDKNGVSFYRYERDIDKYRTDNLLACPVSLGTATNSLLDSSVGEPLIYGATLEGDFCYCSQEELEKRLEMMEKIRSGEVNEEPEWNPNAEEESQHSQETDVTIQDETEIGEPLDADKGSYSVSRELFHVDPEPQSAPVRYTVAARKMDGTVVVADALKAKEDAVSKADETNQEGSRDEVPPTESISSEKGSFAGTGQTLQEPMPETSAPCDSLEQRGEKELEEKTSTEENEAAPVAGISPSKSIVISARESYLYFGAVVEGLRQGRGRTQMPGGNTAYEGGYKDDKRDGFGVYYYQSGELCYAGDWKENKRNGTGVSFRPENGGIHVGRWKDDVPVGTGSIFDRDGNLRYAGRLENGVRQGVGVTYSADDGTVFVGKWDGNRPTGEGSAFDWEGNLIYTGGWKDGKRSGMGTEYSPEGAVLFVGEWEDDQRKNGIAYENGIPKMYKLEK